MRRWHRITFFLLVFLPLVVLAVYVLSDGSLAWSLAAAGAALAVAAIEFVAQGESTKMKESRFSFVFRQINSMRDAYILAACAYPVLVLAVVLTNQSWLSALLLPLGAIGGVLIGTHSRLRRIREPDAADPRGVGWHPHPDHPEWWYYWDGRAWSGTPERRSVE